MLKRQLAQTWSNDYITGICNQNCLSTI